MKRVLFALFCVCAICGLFTLNLSARQTLSEQNAPAKISEKSGDIPALSGRVVDQAGVLSPAAKRELETVLAAHENNTTNQLVIVTTRSLGGKAIEEYSLELGRRWGIGQKGKDNGALLVVAPNDKQVRIEVGYGLEGVLTDALCGIIINRYVIPEFKKGDIEGGVKIGLWDNSRHGAAVRVGDFRRGARSYRGLRGFIGLYLSRRRGCVWHRRFRP